MKELWSCLCLVLSLLACNKGNITPLGQNKNECEEDKDCNDRIYCTKDFCVLLSDKTKKCVFEPSDELCNYLEKCVPDEGCIRLERVWCFGAQDGEKCTPDVNKDRCAIGDGVCQNGECIYPKKECETKECTVSKGCNPQTGECESELVTGDSCDDNNKCTLNDICQDGVCIGQENLVCDDFQKCTSDRCDPEKGCVFDVIPDCCPNDIVDGDESCDAGQNNGQEGWGCSEDCAYIPVLLASPPTGGRSPQVAWISSLDRGIVVYPKQYPVRGSNGEEKYTRYIVAQAVTGKTEFSSERPIDTVPWEFTTGSESKVDITYEVSIAPLPSKDGYFIGALGENGVMAYVIDLDGGLKVSSLAVPYKGSPTFSIRSGAGKDRVFVAWNEKILCDSNGSYTVARLATLKATLSSLSLLSTTDITSGTCETRDSAPIGNVCSDGNEAFVTLLRRETTQEQQRITRVGAIRVLAESSEFVEFDSWQGSSDLFPPLCANHEEGYLSLFLAPREDPKRLALFSIITARKGDNTVYSPREIHSLVEGETGLILFPFVGTMLPYPSNNYIFISPAFIDGPQGESLVPPQALVLDAKGTKVSGPEPYALHDERNWTFCISGAQTQNGHLFVAWFEAAVNGLSISYGDNVAKALFIDPRKPPAMGF